jgi:hypothetical protein
VRRRSPGIIRALRLCSLLIVLIASLLGFTTTSATALSPDKTAWYDTTGLQGYTGETTPSLASNGELEVAYVPVGVTIPKEDIPTLPVTPPTIPSLPVQVPVPSIGSVGGNTLGDALAYGAVEYTVPLQSGGETIDPTSLRAVLTLSLASSSIGVSSGDVLACPTGNTLWAAGYDQDSTQAPPYDCSAGVAVTGNYDAGAHTLTFDLSSSQEYETPAGGESGIFSLVLAPGSSPSGPFVAVLDPPGTSSFDLTSESPASSPGDVAAPGSYSPGLGAELSVGGTSALPAFSSGGPEGLPAEPPSPSSTPTSSATSPAPSTAAPSFATTPVSAGLSSGPQRSVAVILLLAVAVGVWMAASSKPRRPRSLRHSQRAVPESS